jgi:O-methyltransferase
MVGLRRLDNLEQCIIRAIQEGVPGDLVETGVWRGGCGILMRALLGVYNQPDRNVWLADSFEGLPPADEASYPKDQGDRHVELTPYLGVSMETVQDNFRQFELLDGQVKFLKGWFRDTLPTAPMERIAVLRLDGDMYESTMVGLTALYPKVSAGGFVIVDDYGALPNCRAAVEDYRAQHGVSGEIELVDWTGAFWRKDA